MNRFQPGEIEARDNPILSSAIFGATASIFAALSFLTILPIFQIYIGTWRILIFSVALGVITFILTSITLYGMSE